MMMSEQELGYEEKSPGIVVLPGDWIVGAPLQDYLPVSEAVLELELTSNRPDCFSIYGIAREVAAAARRGAGAAAHRRPGGVRRRSGGRGHRGRDRRPGPLPAVRRHRHPRRHHRRLAGVAQGAPHARRHAPHQQRRRRHQLRDARLGPAAARVRRRQDPRRQAHRPPRHGRREDRHAGRRRAHARRPDARHRRRRARRWSSPACSAASDAEIDEHTTDIVLEAANFAGPSILRTELHTGIRSEASNRFEKGIDANLVPGGLDFADRLFAELCGGTVAPGMVDAGGVPPAPAPLRYRPARADALLGYEVPAAEQSGILRRLECEVDEAGVPVGARRRRHRRVDRHAADVPARPHPRGRPHRGGRAHRRLRHGARDAAAAHHRRRADQAAAGAARRAARPGRLRPRRGHHLQLHRPRRPRAARACPRATSASTRSGSPTR